MVTISRLRGRRRGEPTEPVGAASPGPVPATLLERVSDALFSVDRDWRLRYMNQAAERLLGGNRDELLGTSLWDRDPDLLGSIFEREYRAAMAGESPVTFEACHPPLGTWVEVHAWPAPGGLDIHARDITPGMRAAESLRRWARVDEVRFRALVEHAADIVALLNPDGTVRYISEAVERVLGHATETLIGRSAFHLVHPDDLPRMLDLFDRVDSRGGRAVLVECRLRHADGGWRHTEITANDQLDEPGIAGIVVSVRDMTWRWHMERELHAREESYVAIVDESAIGIGVTDLAGHVLSANRALQTFLGYTEQELAGATLADYADPEDGWDDAPGMFEELVSGQQRHYRRVQRFVHRNGDIAFGSLTASLIHEPDGEPTLAVIMIEDITDRQRAADQLATARRRLAASREAERIRLARVLHDGRVQDLLAVSYELAREGAATGQALLAGLAETPAERARRQLLGVVGQLRGIVGELRPPGLVEFGLPTALEGLVAGLQREADGSRPVMQIDVDDRAAELPQELAHTVFRIVQESVRNAMRHANAERVSVLLEVGDGSVDVRIRDDGRGFVVPDRLDAFARTGHFGLVGIAERVELAGGELAVRSTPGHGTTLAARIPAGEVRESDG